MLVWLRQGCFYLQTLDSNILKTKEFLIYDLSSSKNISKSIYSLKEAGAICKKENGTFLWYYKPALMENKLKFEDNYFKNGTLFDFQIDDINSIINTNRILICHSTGLGKTLISLSALSYLNDKFNTNKLKNLIIVPKSLIQNWIKEANLHTTLKITEYPNLSGDAIIMTYSRARIIADKLKTLKIFAIIYDEATALKNPKAKQTKASYLIDAKHKMLLTATPIKNSPLEIYSLMKVLDCSQYIFGSYAEFTNEFALKQFVPYLNRDIIIGYKNLDLLKSKINGMLISRNKNSIEILNQLGKKFEYVSKISYVPLNSIQQAIADTINLEIGRIINEVKSNGFVEEDINKNPALMEFREKILSYYTLARITSCGINSYLSSKNKLKDEINIKISEQEKKKIPEKVSEILRIINDETGEKEKVVVYSSFAVFANEINSILKTQGIKTHLATGETDYVNEINSFIEDDSKVLIITNVGKYGINLQIASYIIISDVPQTYAEIEQIIGRVLRIGQKSIPIIYYLISGEIEQKIYDNVLSKKQWNYSIVGD